MTADCVLLELGSSDVLSEEVVSSDELVGFSDSLVVSSDWVVVFSDPDDPELPSLLPLDDDADDDELEPLLEDVVAEAVVCVREAEVDVPMEPSTATAPNASANVASVAATTRRRIRAIRAARARSLAWASSLGERAGCDMDRTVGRRCESVLRARW